MKNFKKLLKQLGFQTTDLPIFYWNGNCVTNDPTAPVKVVGSMVFKNQSFKDVIEKHKDKKIVIYSIDENGMRLAIL